MSNGAGENMEGASGNPDGSFPGPKVVKAEISQEQITLLKQQNEALQAAFDRISTSLEKIYKNTETAKQINLADSLISLDARIQQIQEGLERSEELEWSEERQAYERNKKEIEQRKFEDPLKNKGARGKFLGELLREASPEVFETIYGSRKKAELIKKQELEALKKLYPEAYEQSQKDIEEKIKLREQRKQAAKEAEELQKAFAPVKENLLKVARGKNKTEETAKIEVEGDSGLKGIADKPAAPEDVIEPEPPKTVKTEEISPTTIKVELVKINDEVLEKLKAILKQNISQPLEQAPQKKPAGPTLPVPQTPQNKPSGSPSVPVPGKGPQAPSTPKIPVPKLPSLNPATILSGIGVGAQVLAAGAAGYGAGVALNKMFNEIYERFTGEKTESVIGEGISNILGYKDVKPVTKEEITERKEEIEEIKAEQRQREQAETEAKTAGRSKYIFKGETYSITQTGSPESGTPLKTQESKVTSTPALQLARAGTVAEEGTAPKGPGSFIVPNVVPNVTNQSGAEVTTDSTGNPASAITTPEPVPPVKKDPVPEGHIKIEKALQNVLNALERNLGGESSNSTVIGNNRTSNSFVYNLNAGTGITSSRKETTRTLNKYMDAYI